MSQILKNFSPAAPNMKIHNGDKGPVVGAGPQVKILKNYLVNGRN